MSPRPLPVSTTWDGTLSAIVIVIVIVLGHRFDYDTPIEETVRADGGGPLVLVLADVGRRCKPYTMSSRLAMSGISV